MNEEYLNYIENLFNNTSKLRELDFNLALKLIISELMFSFKLSEKRAITLIIEYLETIEND